MLHQLVKLSYQAEPERYAAEVLHQTWWSKQIEIARSTVQNRRTAVKSGHATGKSHVAGGIVQWHFDVFNPSITLTTAPSWSSIHDLLWGEVKNQRPKGASGRLMDLKLDGGPMHYAKGHNAATGSGFQGRHEARMLIIVDEAMGVLPYIYEAINAMMTSPDNHELLLGNPTEAAGPYHDAFESAEYNAITISCLEHPNIAAELAGLPKPYPKAVSLDWINEMLRDHATTTTAPTGDAFEFPPGSGHWYEPDDQFRSRVLGLFPRQSTSSVWSEAWIQKACEPDAPMWTDLDQPEIGVDVARFGDDKTTLFARRGPVVTHGEEYHGRDLMETVGRLLQLANEAGAYHNFDPKKIPLKIDDGGMGGGVTDRAKEQGYNVVPINAGERSLDPERYYNRRSELWFVTAYRGRDRKLNLTRLSEHIRRQLIADLKSVRYRNLSDRTMQVESKDALKKRIGHSPDHADGFNLSFATGSRVTAEDVLNFYKRQNANEQ